MILTEIPRAIARYLASKPFFQGPVQIPVRAFCERDIVSWCAQKMESLGLSIVVMATGAKRHGEPFPNCVRLDPISITVRVFESLELNRGSVNGTGVSAESCCEAIIGYLAGHNPQNSSGVNIPNIGQLLVEEIRQAESPEGLWVWDVAVKSSCMIKTSDITQFTEREPETILEPLTV